MTSNRPKIIKLHGDFLYDNIKNTLAELETLETNTKSKLAQFAQEYGLVVLGYSGRDRSVMDNLELLLRDVDNFRQGVYWCLRHEDPISSRLQSLLSRERVYLVEIDGFDQFSADLHTAADLKLPKAIAQPFEIAKDRVRLLIDDTFKSHPVIGSHMDDVLASTSMPMPKVPLAIKAIRLSSQGKLQEAVAAWKEAYEEDPENKRIAYHYADALAKTERTDDLVNFISGSPLTADDITYFLLRAGHNQEVIDLATKILDAPATVNRRNNTDRAIARINRAIALKRLGRTDEMMSDLEFMEQNGDTAEDNIQAGVAALKGDRKTLFIALNASFGKTIFLDNLRTFSVFEDYRDDPEFIKLFASEEK